MPPMNTTPGSSFDRLVDIMRRLRAPDGCPWDREQTVQSMAPCVVEEAHELAEAVEGLGADGAYFRVHHFAQQLASPFPLLAAIGARTKRIEIGTAVIDMRYENPLYMVEDAGAADLIAGGRLQLGISRGSPEQVIDGWRYFGYAPAEGKTDADMARNHAEVFLEVLKGQGFAQPNPRPMFPNPPGLLRVEPHSEGLRERIPYMYMPPRRLASRLLREKIAPSVGLSLVARYPMTSTSLSQLKHEVLVFRKRTA